MNFFPPDPPDDEADDVAHTVSPWWRPSEDELAAILPIGETIVIDENVAIILTMARVHSNGVEFVLERRIRRATASGGEWRRMQTALHGHFAGVDPDRIRYGMVLGDGQQLILDRPSGLFGQEPDRHSLSATGGGGGGGDGMYRFDDGIWLWPLPPEGPLELVVQWPALGVPESHVVLDTAPLLALASQARPVWGS